MLAPLKKIVKTWSCDFANAFQVISDDFGFPETDISFHLLFEEEPIIPDCPDGCPVFITGSTGKYFVSLGLDYRKKHHAGMLFRYRISFLNANNQKCIEKGKNVVNGIDILSRYLTCHISEFEYEFKDDDKGPFNRDEPEKYTLWKGDFYRNKLVVNGRVTICCEVCYCDFF